MSISHQETSSFVSGAASVSITLPTTGLASGDLFVASIGFKYPGIAAPTTVSGWTLVGQTEAGVGGRAGDSGLVNIATYIRESDGTETGTVNFFPAGVVNAAWGSVSRFRKTSGTWNYQYLYGKDVSLGSSWSASSNVSGYFETDGLCVVQAGVNGNLVTIAANTLAASGVTFGTLSTVRNNATSAGDDGQTLVVLVPISSGDVWAAPTFTATHAGASGNTPAGPVSWLVLTETAPPDDGILEPQPYSKKIVWTRQPSSAVRPVWPGLIKCYSPWLSSYELVNGQFPTTDIGGAPTGSYRNGPYGRSKWCDNSGTYLSYVESPGNLPALSAFTWVALVQFTSTGSGFVHGSLQSSGGGYNHGLYVQGSGVPAMFVTKVGTGYWVSGTSTVAGSGLGLMVGTCDSAGNLAIWWKGKKEATASSSAGAIQNNAYPITINRWNSAGAMVGDFYLGALFDRVLSDSEIIRLSQNPWQLFAPISRTFLLGADAGGGGPASYTFSSSGQITFSSGAAFAHGKVFQPSGQLTFSGTAPFVQIQSYTFTPSGSITFSGTATVAHGKVFQVSGEITFQGGVPYLTRGKVWEPGGSINFIGSAPLTFIPAGGVLAAAVNRISLYISRAMRIS